MTRCASNAHMGVRCFGSLWWVKAEEFVPPKGINHQPRIFFGFWVNHRDDTLCMWLLNHMYCDSEHLRIYAN
jgi:hypothetical protein